MMTMAMMMQWHQWLSSYDDEVGHHMMTMAMMML